MAAALRAQSLFSNIESGDFHAVQQLLEGAQINLDERNEIGETHLMVASRMGHYDIVHQLLERDVDVNAKDSDNWSALLNASKEGHLSIVSALIKQKAIIEHADLGGWTALMWASYKGHVNVVQELLYSGANPNIKADHHMSPLLWAAGRGHTQIVEMLLEAGAKVNTTDKNGTTALVWAARKGHIDIVQTLLNFDANVDRAGMNNWTALLVAAKGGYSDVLKAILTKNPNLNAADKDGLTALGIAAKDGHLSIVLALLQKSVYVNLEDRYGDTFLIHAVKAGHEEIAEALLHKQIDIDARGFNNKTALYWAVEKGHTSLTLVLLRYNADTEIATKDGDTPLMKAVRSRNTTIIESLMQKGAKLSATDKQGDNCLHMAIRGKSKKVLELLLRNPANKRLLYRPNARGETAYQLDMDSNRGIINAIYGRGNLNAQEIPQGYDIYSSTIADVLSDPQLHTPMTLGFYAKWGSGKSVLINRLEEQMKMFTQANIEPSLQFSWAFLLLGFVFCVLLGCIVGVPTKWYIGLGVAAGLLLIMCLTLFVVLCSSRSKKWSWTGNMTRYLAKKLQNLRLLMLIMYCHKPKKRTKLTGVVKFLFTDNARLASVVGEKSIAAMIVTLSEALELEYGMLAARLYKVFRPPPAAHKGKFRTLCCVPTFVLTLFILLCMIAGAIILMVFGVHSITDRNYKIENPSMNQTNVSSATPYQPPNQVVNGVLIALGAVIVIAIAANIITFCKILMNFFQPQKKRVQKISAQLESLKMEGYMQQLKKEVELMADMSTTMDLFLNTDTRLVAIVDGLDSCEQERLLQVLDTVNMLFSENNAPFITILAVDPQVIIRGIEQNIARPLFSDSSINGYDYLRNLVHLPFFIQSHSLPIPRSRPRDTDVNDGPGALQRMNSGPQVDSASASAFGSTSTEHSRSKQSRHTSSSGLGQPGSIGLSKAHSQHDLSKSIFRTNYYSDVNPRNMRRLMHIVAVTGRLLKACHIDFSWHRLGAWINITEQWPYRISWIIHHLEEKEDVDDHVTLKAIYDQVSQVMPISKDYDRYLEIDRNPRRLETFLANYQPPLSVSDLRKFMPCTINIDPYLRKLIKELQELQPGPEPIPMMMPIYPSPTNASGFTEAAMSTTSIRQRRHHISGNSGRETLSSPSVFRTMPGKSDSRPSPAASMMVPPWPHPMMYPYMGPYPVEMYNSQGRVVTPGLGMQGQVTKTQSSLSPRISLEGLDISTPLSKLSVEETADILSKIEGLNSKKLSTYKENIHENNITGAVLSDCDLGELKQVMGMTFGDWELFRKTVKSLRDAEEYNKQDYVDGPGTSGNLLSPKIPSPRGGSPCPSPRAIIDDINMLNHGITTPQAQRPAISSDQVAEKLSKLAKNTNNNADEIELTLLNKEMEKNPSVPHSMSSYCSRDSDRSYLKEMEKPGFKYSSSKPDSELSELMQEQDMFDSVMHEMGMGSDEDSETELVQEQSDNDSVTMNNLETAKYKLGSSETFGSHSNELIPNTINPAPSKEDVSKKGKVGKFMSSMVKTLVPGSLKLSKSQEMLSTSKTSLMDRPVLASTSSGGEEETGHQDTTPLMTPSMSKEHLNLRKTLQANDVAGKSAFKVVTPGSSRASSREHLSSPTKHVHKTDDSPDKYKPTVQVVVDVEARGLLSDSSENITSV